MALGGGLDRRHPQWLTGAYAGRSLALFAAAASLTLGLGLGIPWLVASAGAAVSLAFLLSDLSWGRRGGITPLTVMAFSSTLTGLANAVGLVATESPQRQMFFSYAVDRHLMLAALLGFAGAWLPLVGGRMVLRSRAARAMLAAAPGVSGRLPKRHLVAGGVLLGLAGTIVAALRPLPDLGTITAIIYMLPSLTVFALARIGTSQDMPQALVGSLVVTVADALRATLFAYLRIDILLPITAFVLGALLGARSFRPLRRLIFIPIYAMVAVFIFYFGTFAALRSRTGVGPGRVARLIRAQAAGDDDEQRTLVSRLTTFNQLSQIGRVVEEDGFYNGRTLDYLAYAFVPRFVWPEKPTIAKGSWFALRIGQGLLMPDGRASNAVNMTVPGELYLNYGWLGVVVGCLLFGGLLAALWEKTDFWRDPANDIGGVFGFYLLWTALGLGADLQIIVTVIAAYLTFAALGAGWETIASIRRHSPRMATLSRQTPHGPLPEH